MTNLAVPSKRVERSMLVAFLDLTGFSLQSTRVADDELAEILDRYYELVAQRITAAGGRVVKFMGDGVLVVFELALADAAVTEFLALKSVVDVFFAGLRWECRLIVKVHAGPVIAGDYGARGDKRFDVLGKTINTAALVDSLGVALSAEAFRTLSPALRQRFKKHTWPVTYIRTEDPHRFRRR
jgi:adenylate cyclase